MGADLPLISAYFQTLIAILTSPRETFERLGWRGGMGPPLTFTITSYGTAVILEFAIAFAALMLGLRFIPGMPPGQQQRLAAVGFCFMVGAIFVFAFVMVIASILLAIALFLQAGFAHLALFMVGGAKENFETTFRASSYVFGALLLPEMLLTIIPRLPPEVMWFTTIPLVIYLGFALTGTQRIAAWQGFVAAFLGVGFFYAAMFASAVAAFQAAGVDPSELFADR